MKKASSLPVPYVAPQHRIVLFDAVCVLCHGWTGFLLARDHSATLTLCSVQSPEGQAILAHFGYPTDHFDTMLYVQDGVAYEKTEAFIRVITQLPRWSWLRLMRLCPAVVRDGLYDRIAQNRYHWFGQYTQCAVPPKQHQQRFLGHV